MPRDRVFFDYNDFNNVPLLLNNNINVNRYAPGFKKTFLDGWASVELRTPVATTLNNTISGSSPVSTNHGEFGDMMVSLKVLLSRTDTLAISGGLALTVPTARSVNIIDYPSVMLNQLQIQNRAVYFQPYLSYLWTPNERFYMQSLLTVDVASGGSPVLIDFNGLPMQNLGDIRNQTYLNISVSNGYWFYRNPNARDLTGVSAIFELHQQQTVSPSNIVGASSAGNVITVGQSGYHFQLLNMTTGLNMQLGPLSSILLGYTTPIGCGTDKQFSSEFRFLFNRRFGPQNRLTRSQF